jgi:DNA polymerase-3 subunit delta
MKVYANKLAAQMKQSVSPIYIVSGDEPLLVQETCDLIRSQLKKTGFTERELFHAEANFDWEQVLFSANSMSLFAEQKILEIRLPNGKPGDKGGSALTQFAENIPEDTCMLLVLPKVDKRSQGTKWFKALESRGVLIQIWPIEPKELPAWLGQRFKAAGLNASREAVNALAARIEGNLLAAVQDIERLKLSCVDGKVDVPDIQSDVADNSRYDVFGLIDASLSQNSRRALKILQNLRLENAEKLGIVRMLAREIRSLIKIGLAVETGQSIDSVMRSQRVMSKRTSLVGRCVKAHRVADFELMIQDLSRVDKMIKGIGQGDPWDEITGLILNLSGRKLAS